MGERLAKFRDEAPRIVAIGGGTGLSSVLHGLKAHRADLTAVVTVTDDGGSSGRLRRELDVLPPGDIRNCMVALSEDEALLSQLFQYRFSAGRGLKGHSFGNLFLTALTQVVGDFSRAVQLSSEILAIRGRIFPSTSANVVLEATLEGGRVVCGETRISRSRRPIRRIRLSPRRCKPLPETLAAIAEADLIQLGPGSLYTSVIPNLLVEGIPEAIGRSKAVKAYICNLMWQPGETMGYRASDHVRAIHDHAACRFLDYVVLNTSPISGELRLRYAAQRVFRVENDVQAIEAMGIRVLERGLLARHSQKIRHDPVRAAAVAMELAAQGRARRKRGG